MPFIISIIFGLIYVSTGLAESGLGIELKTIKLVEFGVYFIAMSAFIFHPFFKAKEESDHD